ncbi:MAG: GSCFA domain-containing protein [Ruegeria sp.]
MTQDNTFFRGNEDKIFWQSAVVDRTAHDIEELWIPRFRIDSDTRIATFGTGFSQHLGLALRARGFNWIDAEPAPAALSDAFCRRFGYRTQSCRLGTFNTISMFNQWLSWADGSTRPPAEMWEHQGRFYDPYRPLIEPDGFASQEEGLQSRAATLQAFSEVITTAEVLMLTVSSIEAWISGRYGWEVPLYPDVLPGFGNAADCNLRAFHFEGCRRHMADVTDRLRQINPGLRVLLALSPEPLPVTARRRNVLTANTYSKAVLRAVASQMVEKRGFVDYVPLYELVNHPGARGTFFEPDLRRVSPSGMEMAINYFFRALHHAYGVDVGPPSPVSHRVAFQDQEDTQRVLEAWP